MIRILSLLMMFFAAALLGACGDDHGSHDDDGDKHHDDGGHGDGEEHGHGRKASLGSADIGGSKVEVALLGDVAAGHEAVLDVTVDGDAPEALRIWVGTESGQGSMKAKLDASDGVYHGHVETPDPLPEGSAIWVELEAADGTRTKGSFAFPEGHHHAIGPHQGMVAAFGSGGNPDGYVELKLHDDKGDLELWLATDEKITKPFDLDATSKITITFESHDGKVVTLQARDQDTNPDEDDKPNMRDGKTNYFIFPGETGADASWLMGTEFEGRVKVTFSRNGARYGTDVFELVPHGLGPDGHGHEHD